MFVWICGFISDGIVLFNSTTDGSFNGLVFEDQYWEMSTQLPSNPNIYGLGEHVRNLRIDPDGSYHVSCDDDDADNLIWDKMQGG